MRFLLSYKAKRDYKKLTETLQAIADKQFSLLLKNLRHPSLRAKKYDEKNDIWQARVNREYRFYFLIHEGTYKILTIIKHSK